MLLPVLIIIIIFCLGYVGYVFIKHLPDLKNLDINSITQEKQGEAKAKIIQAKFLRSSAKLREKFKATADWQKKIFTLKFNKLKERILELEKSYQPENKAGETAKEPAEILKEASDLMKGDDFDSTEKKLIEVIAQDNKNVQAYESLGELYFKNKKYDQAEEVFKHLIKLRAAQGNGSASLKNGKLEEAETEFLSLLDVDSRVALYYDDLGQIYEMTGKDEKALDAYLKAASIEPSNPKYLDKLIKLGIKAGDKGLAKKSFNRLKQINPENAKLEEFKEALEKMA